MIDFQAELDKTTSQLHSCKTAIFNLRELRHKTNNREEICELEIQIQKQERNLNTLKDDYEFLTNPDLEGARQFRAELSELEDQLDELLDSLSKP